MRRSVPRLTLVLLLTAALLPVGPHATADTYPRQPGIDVLEYVFRLAFRDDTDRIEGLTTVDVRVRGEAPRELVLDLVVATPGGSGMEVLGAWVAGYADRATVTAARLPESERGEPAASEHRGDRLRVQLPPTAEPGDRLFVTVAYAGIPATGLRIGPNHHGERTFFSDNWPNKARHWLPTIDHVYDKARSQMVVTAPARYQVVSNGVLVEETDHGDGRRLTHWRQSVPIATWLNAVGVAEFAVQHLPEFDGRPVQTWVYARDRDAGFDVFDDPTHEVLEYYSSHIGPFAYEKLAQVQAASVGGGMESASTPFYGEDSVSGGVRWRNVIIHEIAHQWFGNAVTESDWDDVWLSEGFATYFTSLFIEHHYGREAFVAQMRSARDRVLAFYADNPHYRIVHDELDDMGRVLTGMQYQKGAWVLHMLRVRIGDEDFWQGIREYYARHFNGHATTADFRRAMEEASGRELSPFFEQWLTRGGVPELAVEVEEAGGEGRAPRLALAQFQDGPTFAVRVPLRLERADGSTERVTVEMDGPAAAWRGEPASPRIVAVEIDPDVELLWRPAGGDGP